VNPSVCPSVRASVRLSDGRAGYAIWCTSPPRSAAAHPEPGFANALLLKDVRLAMEASASAGAPTPMGGMAEALWARMSDAGLDGLGAYCASLALPPVL
jgi:3-hydroxyisobutyrate dehydrogenase-like beta-hydroxyacid dehydrogenase